MKHLTKIGYIAGVVVILLSISRWWFIFYDPSQAMFGAVVGVFIMILAYLYDWMNIKDMKIRSIDNKVDDLWIELKDRDLIKSKIPLLIK